MIGEGILTLGTDMSACFFDFLDHLLSVARAQSLCRVLETSGY